jgi:hypothetical protein
MRVLLRIALCACLVAASATAQRRGGGAGGGFHGGGVVGGFHGGGGGFGHGGIGAPSRPGGGWGYSGFRGGFGYRSYGYGGYYGGFYGGSYWPSWNYGYSYWPSYSDYGYSPYAYYPYSYDPSPNVTVIYPAPAQAAPSTVYVERANPVVRNYDEYGQEIRPSSGGVGAPIYLLAFTDHAIRAAAAYWVDGQTLHYVTLEHEQKQAPLDTVDRGLSLQLNRERRVPFSLPAP